jgi:hypothetical protein
MFSEIQKDLLVSARQSIEERSNRYICCAITDAVQRIRVGSIYEERFDAGKFLKEQIDFGIDGYSSLETWLFSEVGVYPDDISLEAHDVWKKVAFRGWVTPMPRFDFQDLCRQARLAWIDRALETGTMA